MKTTPINVKGVFFDAPFPETMKELRSLIPNEEDRVELLRFAFYHRLRSAAGAALDRATKEEVVEMIRNYRYHKRGMNRRKISE